MTTTTYSERDVQVRGLKLHYQEWGDSSAPPVLMLHGFGVSGHMFDEFADRARDSYHLIALDQRGHGDSAWADDGDYSRDAFVEDVEAFRKEIGWDSFILMGHSMGGLNSAAYTARYPEHVKALVLVDVGPEAAKEGVDNIVRFTRGPDELEFEQFVEMAHQFNQRRTIENIRERMRHRLRPLDDNKWTWKFDRRFREKDSKLRVGSEASNDEMWAMFTSLTGPTLIVRGGESDVLTQEVAERAARDMQNATLVVVPGAGHSVPGDNPDDFTAAVREFLTSLDREPAAQPDSEADMVASIVGAGPTLEELVETHEEAARRRGPGTLTLIVGGGVALLAGIAGAAYVINGNRGKKKSKRAKALAAVQAPVAAAQIDLDRARERSLALASDLTRMSKAGAKRARNAAHQVEVAQARETAMDIARSLGERSVAAERSIVAAVASPRELAKRAQAPLKPLRKKKKGAASTAMKLVLPIAMSMWNMSRKRKKVAKVAEKPKRKMLAWRG